MSLHDLELPPFRAAPLLRSAHLQTMFGSRARKESAALERASFDRVVEVDAETRIRVRLSRSEVDAPRPTLVLVHGLVGDDRSPYMIGCAEAALASGLDVARLNLRNCGGTEAMSTSCYHGAITADVAAACRDLATTDGVKAMVVAGFSLGGGIVLRWAGLLGDDGPDYLRAFCGVSPAVDFDLASKACETDRLTKIYQRLFVNDLKELLARKHALFPDRFPDPTGVRVRTLREFDDRYTSRLSGFQGVEDYYAKASARPHLPNIARPTLVIAAADDPLVPPESFGDIDRGQNAHIRFEAPENGGHCAYVAAKPAVVAGQRDSTRFWAEQRVVQVARSVLLG